jgi:hypothetical protein
MLGTSFVVSCAKIAFFRDAFSFYPQLIPFLENIQSRVSKSPNVASFHTKSRLAIRGSVPQNFVPVGFERRGWLKNSATVTVGVDFGSIVIDLVDRGRSWVFICFSLGLIRKPSPFSTKSSGLLASDCSLTIVDD